MENEKISICFGGYIFREVLELEYEISENEFDTIEQRIIGVFITVGTLDFKEFEKIETLDCPAPLTINDREIDRRFGFAMAHLLNTPSESIDNKLYFRVSGFTDIDKFVKELPKQEE